MIGVLSVLCSCNVGLIGVQDGVSDIWVKAEVSVIDAAMLVGAEVKAAVCTAGGAADAFWHVDNVKRVKSFQVETAKE